MIHFYGTFMATLGVLVAVAIVMGACALLAHLFGEFDD